MTAGKAGGQAVVHRVQEAFCCLSECVESVYSVQTGLGCHN